MHEIHWGIFEYRARHYFCFHWRAKYWTSVTTHPHHRMVIELASSDLFGFTCAGVVAQREDQVHGTGGETRLGKCKSRQTVLPVTRILSVLHPKVLCHQKEQFEHPARARRPDQIRRLREEKIGLNQKRKAAWYCSTLVIYQLHTTAKSYVLAPVVGGRETIMAAARSRNYKNALY